jgi:alpha/beta superfamily hydrolase
MDRKEEREQIFFENHNQKIFGIIHRPKTTIQTPAVVMCHGFGGTKSGRWRMYVQIAEGLSALGITSLRFDFRGSGDSEGDFSEMTLEGEVSDALKAIDFISHDPLVDSSRIGILGRSLGGMVAVLAARRSKKIKSMALLAPAFDANQWLEKWKAAQNPSIPLEVRKEIMSFDGYPANEKFLKQFFSVRMEDELTELKNIPLLHIHGEKDLSVTIDHADLYAEARREVEGKTNMIRMPDSDHDFCNEIERFQAIRETCQWFQKTL